MALSVLITNDPN